MATVAITPGQDSISAKAHDMAAKVRLGAFTISLAAAAAFASAAMPASRSITSDPIGVFATSVLAQAAIVFLSIAMPVLCWLNLRKLATYKDRESSLAAIAGGWLPLFSVAAVIATAISPGGVKESAYFQMLYFVAIIAAPILSAVLLLSVLFSGRVECKAGGNALAWKLAASLVVLSALCILLGMIAPSVLL